ncbi:MAG: tail fiber domain-containing protein [Bacteroidia bacterium]|nr:tail fiber domain-containing protein [Bacteroidia bacterium]
MKKFLVSVISLLISATIFAQSPHAFNYQAVVRNSSGTVIPNHDISFRINILQGSATGASVYSEEHSATTNPFGLVNLEVGNGTNSSGNFSTIEWGNNSYYIKIELDINGGNNYTVMGTNQLLSVPYALYSPGNYKAGNGISISNDTIKNTSPNQLVTLTNGSGISVTGTYPDFTITNTNPDQTISLTGTGATTVTGTYPSFTIHSTDSNTTYNAGTGIDITGGTITNTEPDQAITLSGTGATTVTGMYPNFTINSTDSNTMYQAGTGLSMNGTTFSADFGTSAGTIAEGNHTHPDYTAGGSNGNIQFNNNGTFGGNTNLFWDNANSRLGIGTSSPTTSLHLNGTLRITDDSEGSGKILTSDALGNAIWSSPVIGFSDGDTNYIPKFISSNSLGNSLMFQNGTRIGLGTTVPSGRLQIQADSSAADTEPLFEIKDKTGKTVMVVYQDSVHFFVKDDPSKAQNKGCFAVSGKSSTKAFTNNFLLINSDSTRIYTTDTTMGFGVKNIGASSKTSYMQLTPNNYFIGHEAGKSVTSGLYNSFIGYKSGYKTTAGSKNYFIGYKTGYNNADGYSNIFIGDSTGFSNTSGFFNAFIGNGAGRNNTTGTINVCLGNNSGYSNTLGHYNIFIGYYAGYSNTTASSNVCMGTYSGAANTNGAQNTYIGNWAGAAANGYGNSFFGHVAGRWTTTGSYNTYIGTFAAENNATGNYNTYIGYEVGNLSSGSSNVFIGYQAGFNETGSNKLYIENSSSATPLIGGDFSGDRVGINRMPTTYTLEVGGTIWANGATITAGSATWSDVRYKTNILTLENSLEKICKLRGVCYDWKYSEFVDKNFPKGHQIGVIAQEIEEIFPELITTDNEGYKSVAYEKFTPILLEAVKSLNNKINDQEKEIETLKNENSQLKSDNTILKSDNTILKSKIQEIDNLKAEIANIKLSIGTSSNK